MAKIDQASNRSVVVNIMIDAELSPFAQNLTAQEEEFVELSSLVEMLENIDSRCINATVYYIGSAEGHEYPDLQVGDEVNPRPDFIFS